MSSSSNTRDPVVMVLAVLAGLFILMLFGCGVALAVFIRVTYDKDLGKPAPGTGKIPPPIVVSPNRVEEDRIRELERRRLEQDRQHAAEQLRRAQEQNRADAQMRRENEQQLADERKLTEEEEQRRLLRIAVLGDPAVPGSTGRFGEPLATAPAAVELPTPPAPLPPLAYAEEAVQAGERLGWTNIGSRESKFIDRAPPGGVLVGAIVFKSSRFGTTVAGIQPIYQRQDQYVAGGICGTSTSDTAFSLAEAGEAVSGFRFRSGLVVDVIALTFAPLEGLQLNIDDERQGERLGSPDRDLPKVWSGDSKLIVGIYGTYENNTNVRSLGMLYADQVTAGELGPPLQPLRTFSSANGKFTVEAKLVKINDDGTVSLEREDGSRVSAPIASLSEEDQKYIESQR
ncbi:hypothetical protein LOC68_27355 [Blastopirellula sp. JC732]|uniref:SLA1 homology domain-containing protein n=1 Tax=Blastopirellula sediminis TaxID=2894196 RepID=A0A9X1SMX7_9BACT|nr:SHD1 domain-containing protein [Blastopirellula sediminis]MCC9604572.1 hypothetical protein [Blastopirellula sediminis]MCC9632129.1 hypothetical protein [Blastopirellula sediminis]